MNDQPSEPADAIAVISDVHGNLPALTAVLSAVEALGVRRIWCLGDTVGYGPFAAECLTLVRERCEIVLAGNHEVVLREAVGGAGNPFGGSAGAGIDHALATLDPAAMEYVRSLPTHRVMPEVELYHAASTDPVWTYVIGPADAREHMGAQRAPASLVGHSHQQLIYWRPLPDTPGDLPDGGPAMAGASYPIGGQRVVANPGSVGQPRDGDARAAFATLTGTDVTFHRIEYDIDAMEAAVAAAGLPADIAARLRAGR